MTASDRVLDPERYGEDNLTNEELDSWYDHEYDHELTAPAFHANTEWDVLPGWNLKSLFLFLRGRGYDFHALPPEWKAQFRDNVKALTAEPTETPEVDWIRPASTVTTTLPDGTILTETAGLDGSRSTELQDSAGKITEQPETDYEPTDVGTPSTGGIGGFSPRLLIIGGGGILSLLVLGFLLLLGGDDDGQGTSEGAGGGGPSVATSGAPPAAGSADACTALHQQEIVLELTSPDVQPILPLSFAQGQQNWQSPRLEWSSVPPETTEIVILVSRPRVDLADAYRADPKLWWRGESIEVGRSPIGTIRWTLTGIDPAATSLARTSASIPTPAGTTELRRNGTIITINGEDLSTQYLGPALPGESYLFTVFALCFPPDAAPELSLDTYNPSWLQQFSIATGWFFTDATW